MLLKLLRSYYRKTRTIDLLEKYKNSVVDYAVQIIIESSCSVVRHNELLITSVHNQLC